MSFTQTSYSENMAAAVPGMPLNADFSADTRICETAAGIGFGLAVGQGSSDKGGKLGASDAGEFVGVSIRDKTLNNDLSDKYAQQENMGVMTRGDIAVVVGSDVAPGDVVTFDSETGVFSATEAGAGQVQVVGARWMTSANNGGVAVLRLPGFFGELPAQGG